MATLPFCASPFIGYFATPDAAVPDRLVRAIRLPMKSAMNSGLGAPISKSAHSGAPHHAELELGALVHRKPPRHILRALGPWTGTGQ